MPFRRQIINDMLPNVAEFLSHHPLNGTDGASMEQWRAECETSWSLLADSFLSDEERTYGTEILSTLLASYEHIARLVAEKQYSTHSSWPLEQRTSNIQALLNRPQVEQRTEDWYMEGARILSASQFSTILKSGRTRGQLVLDKATRNVDTSARRTVVLTMELNPFTWGIRFEPVVKQIYCALTCTRVAELGRLKHGTDTRIAASPDGLVVEGPDQRLGRFVEFKAPVTRSILNTVPTDYLTQMQIQMEVGNVEECDYLEIKFNSSYNSKCTVAEPPADAKFWGQIFLVGDEEQGTLLRYEYSPLKDCEWKPTLEEGEAIVEVIPWWTSQWFLTTVGRSRAWFASVQPAIESFWADVAAARRGEFVMPESKRKLKERNPCRIMDDAGNEE
jgi:hypothetical protein